MDIDFHSIVQQLVSLVIGAGKHLVLAGLLFFVGRYLIKLINRVVARMLARPNIDAGVRSFVASLVNIVLLLLLMISVIGALGVNTTSFAALLASAGVAIGMALSGNLQNVAGGLIILIFRPYRVGDLIEVNDTLGTVQVIQIFHTVVHTLDNRTIYLPNGNMSSGSIVNYSRLPTRRVEWTFGVTYGTDFQKAKQIIEDVLHEDRRILKDPAPAIVLNALNNSSVDIIVRAWTKGEWYFDVLYAINLAVYEAFNAKGVEFPFPTRTVYMRKSQS